MLKLKITMAVFGAILGIEGLLDLTFPIQRAAGLGLKACATQAQLALTVLGATWLVVGGWIIAAACDPVRHRSWVHFVITMPVALMLALLLAAARGSVAIREIAVEMALNGVFLLLFIAFLPRSAAKTNA